MAPKTASTATTRALVLHGPRDLRIETRPLPPPSANELQISIIATGICGSDLHYYSHGRNGDLVVREPLTPGHESAGIVTSLGSASLPFSIGDLVAIEVGVPCSQSSCTYCTPCSGAKYTSRYNLCPNLHFRSSAKSFPHYQGTLQEKINHPAKWCYALPSFLSPTLGLLLEPLSVALHAARRAAFPPHPNATVLVLGAGSIGLLCAYTAKRLGAKHVVIADIDPGRVDFAVKNKFADGGFLSPRGPASASVESKLALARDTASKITNTVLKFPFLDHSIGSDALPPTPPPEQVEGGSSAAVGEFDVVFECTGAEACVQTGIYAAKAGGKVMLVGMGTPIQTLPISAAALREVDLCGVFRYAGTYEEGIRCVVDDVEEGRSPVEGRSPIEGRPNPFTDHMSAVPQLPDLQKLVTHRFKGLEGAKMAFEMAGKTMDQEGKLVMKVVVEMK